MRYHPMIVRTAKVCRRSWMRGPAPMLAEALRLAQTELLADEREVVAGAAVGRALAAFDQEERPGRGAEQPVRSAR